MKVLCFGGGKAMPDTVLMGLKHNNKIEILTGCTMMDSGGSTGVLRKTMNVLSPGDLRRHLLALANITPTISELLNVLDHRIDIESTIRYEKDSRHQGHNIFNLLISAYEKKYGIEEGYEKLHKLLNVSGLCIPVVLENSDIFAELVNGDILTNEDEIDIAKKHDPEIKISRVFLNPKINANPKIINAIKEVDLIIIGPGDLYSSIIPSILPVGINEAITKSKAKKILIVPAMTKHGETHGAWGKFSVEDYSNEIEKYLGQEFDFVLYNNKDVDELRIKQYQKDEPRHLEVYKMKNETSKKFVGRDLLWTEGPVEFDPNKVAKAILDLGGIE